MLMDLEQSLAERYAILLAEMPAEQAQEWIATRASELARQAEQLQPHVERRLQQQWRTTHDGQAPDLVSLEAMRSQAAQIAQDTVLSVLWEELETADEYNPSSTRRWPDVPYMPSDATTELVEHLWPQHLENLDFMVLAEKLIDARHWDELPVPSEPTDAMTRELEIRVLDALAREAAANPPKS